MNDAVKTAWCEALESGAYAQAKGCLKSGAGYCCLGVLTDLYLKSEGLSWSDISSDTELAYSEGSILPEEVAQWAELRLNSPIIDERNGVSAIRANDQLGLSFTTIAGLIRVSPNL